MSIHRYKAGDTIVLKKGPVRAAIAAGSGKVLATLPESQGALRYRVRIESENFDRSVAEDEIDSGRSAEGRKSAPEKEPMGQSWLTSGGIRTRK